MFDVATQRFTGHAAKGIDCICCGLSFAIPETLYRAWVQRERTVHCPGCDGNLSPAGKTEADRLRDELVRAKQRTEQAEEDARRNYAWAQREQRRVSARKAVATRLRRKLAAGRCPCCSHKFKDLAAHMKARHPKFDPDKAAEAMATK